MLSVASLFIYLSQYSTNRNENDSDSMEEENDSNSVHNDDNQIENNADDFAYTEGVYQDPNMDSASQLCSYRGWWIIKAYYPTTEKLRYFEEMSLNDSDVILTGFPKSGTTWMQEIIYRIVSCNDSNASRQESAQDLKIFHRFPPLEGELSDFIERNKQRTPRLFKTHLPYSLLSRDAKLGKGKIIHIARNAKDVLVSYYHFSQYLSCMDYTGSFEEMFTTFLNGTVAFGPWLRHVEDYWEHRADANVLFLTYEELHKNPSKIIQDVATFLNIVLTKDQINNIVTVTSFKSMKCNNTVNFSWLKDIGMAKNGDFIRKGEVGDWRNYLTPEMNEQMEVNFLKPLKNKQLTFDVDT